ncbi:TonB-dependent receptor [Sphingomonas montanisoli]|uniref:TonB-dependent receptor n=1 Tax=Sphingomonas montanisoli TaxID=2606412 RepID=A0A5D9C5H8_9SPHN|nr:TonB-dependent receptor [Sphingomonas montanisoli]TZG26290.1 TonB-dependent receptor [Sphingomonas montanisoli]
MSATLAALLAAQEIIVTGQGLGSTKGDAAYDVVSIDRSRIETSASGRMEDLLRDAAGFQQFRRSDSRSAHPTSQGATLRGLGGNASTRALVLLDGVPMVDPFGGWIGWAALDPARIGHIRVTRGGGTGALGPGALAGTIELTSATPDQIGSVNASIAYGSRESIDADVTVGAKLGGGYAILSAGHAQGDGFVPIVEEQRGAIDRAARYRQSRASARAVMPLGEATELQANGSLLVDRRDRGLPFTGNGNVAVDSSLRLVGHGDWGWEAASWLQLRQFSSGFAAANATRTAVNRSLDQYRVPATGVGGRFEIRPPLGDRVTLRLGGDARRVTGRTQETVFSTSVDRRAGGRQDVLGAFAEASFEADPKLVLTASGRIDHWSIDHGYISEFSRTTGLATANARTFADRSGDETTARGGIAWSPLGALTVRAAAYTGWRLPTLNELYRPFRTASDSTLANAALNPERVRGIDGGFDFHPLPGWRMGVTVFDNRLEDAIANVTVAANTRQRQNLSAIRSRGIELDAEASWREWRGILSWSHTAAKVRSNGAAAPLAGLRPAQTPRDQASATLEWRRGDLRAATTVRYVGKQFEDDLNRLTLDDAVTVDAVVGVPIGRGFTAELRAENLGNARVEATRATDGTIERATPRTLWFALRYAVR